MSKRLSFIHAADLHLDSSFQGLSSVPEHIFKEIQMSTFKALDNLVRVAIEKDVDFVLLVGDLFDNDHQSLQAQIRLRKAFEQLDDVDIPVYISFGNHDFIQGNMYSITYPDNVFIFPSEQISHFTYTKDHQALAQIYGFSYEKRAITENKAVMYERKDQSIPFHIATLHGSIKNNKEHDVYAPFVLNDLLQNDFNYWALGHIHKRSILSENPPIVYPGNTQGRHRIEEGEKGCYYVTISETEHTLDFIPLHVIEFANIEVDLHSCKKIHELEEYLRARLQSEQTSYATLIHLTLKGNDYLQTWANNGFIEDIIELIHETTTDMRNWQYIYSFVINVAKSPKVVTGDHFIGQLSHEFDDIAIQSIVDDLYNHRQGRKYLTLLSSDQKQVIIDEAKQLLFNKLLKEDMYYEN